MKSSIRKRLEINGLWWACGDSNTRPLPCQGSADAENATEQTVSHSFFVGENKPKLSQRGQHQDTLSQRKSVIVPVGNRYALVEATQ
jgi:hypothetical protein